MSQTYQREKYQVYVTTRKGPTTVSGTLLDGEEEVCLRREWIFKRAQNPSSSRTTDLTMGNTYGQPRAAATSTSDAAATALFAALDTSNNGHLTLAELMHAPQLLPALVMPHSLSVLYFFDIEKDGTISEAEFVALVDFCREEKKKFEDALSHDVRLRELIKRASAAGIKDGSFHGRTSFRRFSSYSNVRSIFSKRNEEEATAVTTKSQIISPGRGVPSSSRPPRPPCATIPSSSAPGQGGEHFDFAPVDSDIEEELLTSGTSSCRSSLSADDDEGNANHNSCGSSSCSSKTVSSGPMNSAKTISMYSSQREFDALDDVDSSSATKCAALLPPENCTALDAAVLENIMRANIHNLAELLHADGCREKFMQWLWKLADFNCNGVVTLEELRIFLAALVEDGIELEELAFYKEGGMPLEECIINEFDTTHKGLLSRDEFMVLADLVTREYEFWENRHLERVGDYALGRTVGRGSSGVVRLAMRVHTREKVAIKIIKKGKCSDLSRLDREIQSLMAARHEHIVALEEVLESETNIFIVMELCGGGSLVDIVRLYPEERMPEETARFYMRQLFAALAFCHKSGICHRDVRLDNLMIDNSGSIKICDFGHSGVYTPGWDIFQTSLVGSVYNLSPEQVMGQCYSGENIDIWSTGVVVYSLLVGHPPFFDPDTTRLLECITSTDFTVPSFVSEDAADLIRCMIRATPGERIPIAQMLHHPWFYAGPEYGPQMDTVVIPIDSFFKKRPDLAEMIMAGFIHEHNVHFHLADILNPRSSPEDLRGQDWALKCSCPNMDIKFTVSLFTKDPALSKAPVRRMHVAASCSTLTNTVLVEEAVEAVQKQKALLRQADSDERKPASDFPASDLRRAGSLDRAMPNVFLIGSANGSPGKSMDSEPRLRSPSTGRPPLPYPVTPLTPLREPKSPFARRLDSLPCESEASLSCMTSSDGLSLPEAVRSFDFEQDNEEDFAVHQFVPEGRKVTCRKQLPDQLESPAQDSQDVDGSATRMSRSATVDAFPHKKVFPQREMPEAVRLLNFDRPDVGLHGIVDEQEEPVQSSSEPVPTSEMSRSLTLEGVASCRLQPAPGSSVPSSNDRAPSMSSIPMAAGSPIARGISKYPSKTVSPQPQQCHMEPSDAIGAIAAEVDGLRMLEDRSVPSSSVVVPNSSSGASRAGPVFQPFIEVRLRDGESGLFLRICRKLKTICDTKLAVAAERQRKKSSGRRSLSTLRRTASARALDASGATPPPSPSALRTQRAA